ncbi:577_t:CDS:2, partial [Entrophospora sp. SA101]
IRVGGPKYMEHIKAGPEDDKESDVEESEEESDIEDEKKVKRVIMKRKKEKVVMKTMNKKCQRPPGGSQHPNSTCEVDRNTVEQYGNDLFEIGVVIYDQNMLYKEKQQQLQTEQNKLHDTQEYLACDCNLAKLCKIVPQFPLNQQIAPVLCIFVRIVLKLMEAISVKEWGRVIRGGMGLLEGAQVGIQRGIFICKLCILRPFHHSSQLQGNADAEYKESEFQKFASSTIYQPHARRALSSQDEINQLKILDDFHNIIIPFLIITTQNTPEGYKEWINVIEKILAQGVYMTERQITKGRGAKDLVKRKDQNQKSRQRSQAQSENIVMDWANDNTSDVQQT